MKLNTIKFFIACFLLSSCEAENPFVSKEFIEQLEESLKPDITNIALISENDVYYLADIEAVPQKITETPENTKSQIAVSHSGKKFAYLNKDNQIEVIDSTGTVLNILSSYTDVKSFDWSEDDSTLYILNGNSLSFYGPDMDIPTLTSPSIPNYAFEEFTSLSISSGGDLAYTIKYRGAINSNTYRLIQKPNDGSNNEIIYSNSSVKDFTYVNFSPNAQDLVLGVSNSINVLEEVYFFEDLNNFHSFTSEFDHITPTYNSAKQFIVGGYNNFSQSSELYLYARSLTNSDEDYVFDNFSNENNPIYVDWK